MEKTIEIPEGYEARIEGNKVIIEPKENEDERIVGYITDCIRYSEEISDTQKEQCLAWLGKQKEQKPTEWSEAEKMHLANAILAAEKEWGVNSYTARFLEALRDNYKKCNSRWKPSEEQVYSLGTVVKGYDNCTVGSVGYNLKELYEQLQKLL